VQNQCLTSKGAKYVFLTTVLPSLLDQEQIVPHRVMNSLSQADTRKQQEE